MFKHKLSKLIPLCYDCRNWSWAIGSNSPSDRCITYRRSESNCTRRASHSSRYVRNDRTRSRSKSNARNFRRCRWGARQAERGPIVTQERCQSCRSTILLSILSNCCLHRSNCRTNLGNLSLSDVVLVSRNRYRSQDTDDRYNDHQLDQGKTFLYLFHVEAPLLLIGTHEVCGGVYAGCVPSFLVNCLILKILQPPHKCGQNDKSRRSEGMLCEQHPRRSTIFVG